MPESLEDASNRFVEVILDMKDFFDRHEKLVLDKIETADTAALEAAANDERLNGDMVFFAESLPIINGLLQVGAKRDDLNVAIQTVKKERGEAVDPLIVLSAFMFIYVAELGAAKAGQASTVEGEKRREPEVWSRILKRVKLLEPGSSAPTTGS